MPGALRVAVVGAGLMGRWHAFYARRAGAEVVAVVDPDSDRGVGRAARRYEDLASCLAGERLDAVHVCAPSSTHDALARQAVAAGVHALVEKPLARTAEQTASLLALAAERGVQLAPVHQLPFQRGFRRILGRLDELGPLVEASYSTRSAGGDGADAGRRRELLFEILPHPLSLFARLPGTGLAEADWRLVRSADDELEVHGAGGGLLLRGRIGLRGRPTRNELELVGERASARVDLFHGFGIVVGRRPTSRAAKVVLPFDEGVRLTLAAAANLTRRGAAREPAYPGLRPLIEAFYAAVRGEAPAPIPPAEIAAIAELVDRLRENRET